MSTVDTALPMGGQTAEAGEPANHAAPLENEQANPGADDGQGEGQGEGKEPEAKKEKSPEQREIERLRRRVDAKTRQLYEARAQAQPPQQQQPSHGDDDEPVTLTRAELQRKIEEQARQLAPSMTEQRAEAERRHGVVASLAKEWGAEKFDTLSAELDEAFNGLADRSGTPKPATDAIFHADDPKGVIEYLTDPDNADEADQISRMTAVQAGRAIAKLEGKLDAEKSKAKPKPSSAPTPLEPARGGGAITNKDPANMTDAEFAAWRKQQIKQRK